MDASSSSSSMTFDGFTYDVFLSFRGPDTRLVFTGSLWKALENRGIRTFFDKEDIPKGKEITPSLLQSIEQSRMALVVLSPNYASSAFCLDELSHIRDHIKGKGRLVWPIFYDVNPSDVRWLEKGTYKEAMDAHEAGPWHNTYTVQKWKKALHEVANFSGTCFENGGGYQHEFIDKIVEEVSKQIKPYTLDVADYLVGLEPQKQEVISLLNVGSDDKVHMVGIHGIGGIGKTTLSLEVYNSIVHQFEGSCFLGSVRENSEKHGLTHLQKIILSKIVGEKGIELDSVKQGITIIQRRLRQKKVLLILDDVDKLEQLTAIAGKPEWFCPGSRVIITTRDKRLLTRHGVKSTHGMKELDDIDALELLKWKAFHTDNVNSIYADVLNRAASYASGHPLALEVIGSNLFEKGIEEWEYALNQYEKFPDKDIQKVLEASFNTLEVEEKSAFLDIACCFKGYELTEVEKILHAHRGDRTKAHIRVLVEKSLIKISQSGNVTIHDLIEDMGKEIVRLESPEEPKKRSRLWFPEDIAQVLKENTGTGKNEILCLNSWIEVEYDGQAFKKMKNLRTLIIRCGQFSEYPKHLPNSLRVLQWHCSIKGLYPSSFTQDMLFDSHPKKLVICEIDCEHYASTMCKNLFNKKFEHMRLLVIKRCSLTHIGDISGLTNLEEISFSDWGYLTTIDDSFGLLDKLKILYVGNCRKLTSFPPLILPSLEKLVLVGCYHLESVPSMDRSLDKLKILIVRDCYSLKSIPSIKLPSLGILGLSYCRGLESIPPMYGLLGKLKTLRVYKCDTLRSIPPLNLPTLEELNISHCDSLLSIPSLNLPSLEELNISHCDCLSSISLVEDESLGKLKILSVKACKKLTSIPPLKCPSLEKLKLKTLDSLESIRLVGDGSLGKLKILSVKACKKLTSIPPLKCPSLEKLKLKTLDSLESIRLVGDGSLGKLKILSVKACKKLTSIPPLKCPSLEKLKLKTLDSLESIRLVGDGTPGDWQKHINFPPPTLPLLEVLDLSNCSSLESIAPMDVSMGKLKFLSLKGCRNLTSIPSLELPLLEQLNLSYCDYLESFPEILGVVKNITEFNMVHTPIEKIPFSFQNLTRLQTLNLKHCGNVQLPSSIVTMSELTTITMVDGGWLFSKQDKGEEKGSPMQSSQVEFISLKHCNLSDESLAIGLKWFANVKELNLSSSNFTILPKCIEQCHFLWNLVLDECMQLQEIKGIPPSLKTLSAMECTSLTTSSKSKLLNQELHEVGNTNFLLPLAEIPEWFGHHCSSEISISFWFRNKFPAVALCVVSPYYSPRPFNVFINGNIFFYTDDEDNHRRSGSEVDHLHLFHMQMEKFNENMGKALSKNNWNHAKIDLGTLATFLRILRERGNPVDARWGIHVLKEEEEEDVIFTSP